MSPPQSESEPNGEPRPRRVLLEPPDTERPASAAPTEPELETESPGGSLSAGHDPYAALRYPGYWFYSLGWVVSVIGSQVQSVAVQWQIFHRVGSAGRGAGDGIRIAGLTPPLSSSGGA